MTSNNKTGIHKAAAAATPAINSFNPSYPSFPASVEGAGEGVSELTDFDAPSPLQQAEHRLKQADNDLRHAEGEIVRFRKTFMTPMGPGWGWRREYFPNRDELDREWKKLMQRRSTAFIQHQAAMREWAKEKQRGQRP